MALFRTVGRREWPVVDAEHRLLKPWAAPLLVLVVGAAMIATSAQR